MKKKEAKEIIISELESFRSKSDPDLITMIDDGGWRAFMPLTVTFIKNPSNEFIGE